MNMSTVASLIVSEMCQNKTLLARSFLVNELLFMYTIQHQALHIKIQCNELFNGVQYRLAIQHSTAQYFKAN